MKLRAQGYEQYRFRAEGSEAEESGGDGRAGAPWASLSELWMVEIIVTVLSNLPLPLGSL